MRHLKIILNIFLFLGLTASIFFNQASNGHAQTEQGWLEPVNLSNSGASTSPVIVVDSAGTIHVIWIDEYDGYKYTQSTDGLVWVSPKTVNFPFKPKGDSQPIFVVDPDGLINVFWRDVNNILYYSQTQPLDFGIPSNWTQIQKLADSALDFDVVADDKGTLHISYIRIMSDDVNPAGVYYRRRDTSGWSAPSNLYVSHYFRSLTPEDAHVRIAAATQAGVSNIYSVWDDRQQKRIYIARSLDGGLTWGTPSQARGPEESAGLEFPFNIDLTVNENEAILLWQLGLPGSQCTQYSQWSLDGGSSFDEPVKMLDEFATCPQQSKPIYHDSEFSVISLINQNEVSLIAWNGSNWSNAMPQSDLSTFINPVTFDSVIISCQMIVEYKENLYFVGCDQGSGGDIWFSSRPLGAITDWFPPPTTWFPPVIATSTNNKLSELSFVADDKDKIHAFWIQSLVSEAGTDKSTIQYSEWNGISWSNPVAVIADLSGKPIQLTAYADNVGRLLLSWVDEQTGELLFLWASSEKAGRTSEWVDPIYIPTASQLNSAPNILADASGKLLLGYAIPINEKRGIYFVDSIDDGRIWSQPSLVFDATLAGWDMVDQPKICLTGDGRLHVVFDRYSSSGDRRQSLGLYYSQSANGGVTWSEPQAVSEKPVFWSAIMCDDTQTLHRFWQEERESLIITYHQISKDGGITWSKSISVSNVGDFNFLTESVMDQAGNPHFLQLTGESGQILISHQKWDDSRWIVQEPKEMYVDEFGIPTSFAAAIASSGNLLVSTVIDVPYPVTDAKNEIFSTGKFIGLPDDSQTPNPVFIATADLTSVQIQTTAEPFLTPTQVSSLANLPDPTSGLSRKRNIAGILLVGGILILVLIVIRPRSKKTD